MINCCNNVACLCFDGMRARVDRGSDVPEEGRTVEQIAAFDRFDRE